MTRMGRTYKLRAYDRSRLELACAQVDQPGDGLRLEEFFQLAQARRACTRALARVHARFACACVRAYLTAHVDVLCNLPHSTMYAGGTAAHRVV